MSLKFGAGEYHNLDKWAHNQEGSLWHITSQLATYICLFSQVGPGVFSFISSDGNRLNTVPLDGKQAYEFLTKKRNSFKLTSKINFDTLIPDTYKVLYGRNKRD